MKVVVLVLLALIACVVMFILGVVAPARSRRLQQRADSTLRKGEAKGDQSAGRVGDMTRDALDKARKAVDKSAEKGRELHDRAAGK